MSKAAATTRNRASTGSYAPRRVQHHAGQWTYGAGVSWDVFKHAGLRVEWQRYNNVGGHDDRLSAPTSNLMSVGAYLKF